MNNSIRSTLIVVGILFSIAGAISIVVDSSNPNNPNNVKMIPYYFILLTLGWIMITIGKHKKKDKGQSFPKEII